jgi:predicted Zn finger-like uncharacterized protein
MPLSLVCPDCGERLRVGDHLAGKKIKCPKCSSVFTAEPQAEAGIAPAPSPSSGSRKDVPPEADLPELDAPPRTRRPLRDIRRDPGEEVVSTLIPYRNGRALAAYYCAVFSTIPCVGLLLGPIAVLLGFLGLRYVSAHPSAKGTGHAIFALIWGALTALANWGVVLVILISGGLAAWQNKKASTYSSPQPVVIGPIGEPLFARDRDLTLAAAQPAFPAEPGRKAAVRVDGQFFALALSPDGKKLVVGGVAENKIFDLASGTSSSMPPPPARTLAFSPDGELLAAGGIRGVHGIYLIDIVHFSTLQVTGRVDVDQGPIRSAPVEAAFSSDGAFFAAASHSTFKLWGTVPWNERPHNYEAKKDWHIGSLTFAPRGHTLAVGVHDGVLLWDARNIKQLALLPQAGGVCAVAYSSDGKTLAAASPNGQVKLWDSVQKRELHTLQGTSGDIRVLRFSPDGQLLADTNALGFLKVWDATTGKLLAERKGGTQGNSTAGLAFTPDGKLLLSADAAHGVIKAWDVAALRGG